MSNVEAQLYKIYPITAPTEEDNDDVIPIVHAESTFPRELYGEYYLSELVRFSDDRRRLIVSEDDDGVATGVMFLNRTVDVDSLNENFELGPYNGLRKLLDDQLPPAIGDPVSRTFISVFSRGLQEGPSPDVAREESIDSVEETTMSGDSTIDDHSTNQELPPETPNGQTVVTFADEAEFIPSNFDAYYKSKLMASAFVDSMFGMPQQPALGMTDSVEVASLEGIELPAQPLYHGEPNAFVLEIFATQDHIKRRHGKDFVEAAFECFPDLDYCAILLPFSHPYLPILENFVRVPLRCNKDYPMTLYVTHRAAFHGDLTVRDAASPDRGQAEDLLRGIPRAEEILEDFDRAIERANGDPYCYVCQWKDTVVGVVILSAEKEAAHVKRRYHVEDYIAVRNIRQDSYGRIRHFVLAPIFSIHLQHFFCEITRLSDLTVLYYRLTESALSALTRTRPLAVCMNGMVPVTPRWRTEYECSGFQNDEPQEEVEPFALFMITPRLAMTTNVIVDSKIVIVGASDCGLAFAEYLAFSKDFVRFGNLTLISPNGLPFETKYSNPAARMIPFRGRYCREYRGLLAARAWINVVYGTVVSIQRKEKFVAVMNQGNIQYDYLILTCGLQYRKPRFDESLGVGEEEVPWNCLTINDDFEAAKCLEKLQLLTNNLQDEKRIVFYGHNVDCYCALQGLLELGIKGSWITCVQAPLPQCDKPETIFFEDCEVFAAVMGSIAANGIEMIVGWELIEWKTSGTAGRRMIESVSIRSKGRTRTIRCDALVTFHKKTIDMNIFLAICRSGLVFDGQLVIGADFRTNDPSIFAAGTMTKYRSKLCATSFQHGHYDRAEIGEAMAKVIRRVISKQHRGNGTSLEPFDGKTQHFVPTFRSPKIVGCVLPGGYRYLHVCKPGIVAKRRQNIRNENYGQVLVTGSCASPNGYFRLRLNTLDTVTTVTCFTRKDFEVRRTIQLYGLHESLLNELKIRFEKSLIVDFYAYFREPWAMAIFHDRFPCLRLENRATMLSKTAVPGRSLFDDCVRVLGRADWQTLSEKERRAVRSRFVGSVYQQEIEQTLMEFLEFCEDDLPVYCTPARLRELYADVEESPLYRDV